MIDQEKYVKVIANPLEKKVAAEPTVNNVDATFTENGIYTAQEPYTGFGVVTVDVPEKVIQSLSITPTTSEQIISGGGGVDGYAPITVNSVTSSIDSNIQAQNIVQGTTILGVAGTAPIASYPFRQLSISSGKLLAYASGDSMPLKVGSETITDIGDYALAYSCRSLTYTGNINWNSLTGVSGERAFVGCYYYSNITGNITFNGLQTITGSYAFYYAFYEATITGNIEFKAMVDITGGYYYTYQFYYAFAYATLGIVDFSNLEIVYGGNNFYYAFYASTGTVKFNKLKTISAGSAFYYAFSGDQYTSGQTKGVSIVGLFDSVETVTGSSAFRYAFQYNNQISGAITFSKLNTISASQIFQYAFRYCPNLTSLSFPALTSTSFGSYTNQFDYMLSGCTDVTVHFPSNLQSVIGSWSSVTSGFSGTNTTVLFDLTATS